MIAYLLAAALSCDPQLTALFTPIRPRLGRYEACTTTDTLDVVALAGGYEYGRTEALDPLDAFGAGPYDRPRLARLYAGMRVRVVRGWRMDAGGFESVTLLSPYPDASLTRLLPGTLMIRLTLPPR